MAGRRPAMVSIFPAQIDRTSAKPSFSGYKWTYFENIGDSTLRTRADILLRTVDWDALRDYASRARDAVHGVQVDCILLSDIGLGCNNMVRILEFNDGVKWVARLRMPDLSESESGVYDFQTTKERIEVEYYTALLVCTKTHIPIPAIHTVESTHENAIHAPFMLMDCIEGNVGMDLGLELPAEHKFKFIKQMAGIHVALSTIRLPKIGTFLGKSSDGSYKQGPIPGIGGPFSTAAEYFAAWADNARYPHSEHQIRELGGGDLTEEIMTGVESFKSFIKQIAKEGRLSMNNEGPFPLCHGDFGHNNIIFSDKYDLLSVIDWEHSYAGPLESFADFPLVLSTIPQSMDAPSNYDSQGNPIEEDTKEALADQKLYVECVKQAERALGTDKARFPLSKSLEDTARQQLITAMRLYNDGKCGLYGRMIEMFHKATHSDSLSGGGRPNACLEHLTTFVEHLEARGYVPPSE